MFDSANRQGQVPEAAVQLAAQPHTIAYLAHCVSIINSCLNFPPPPPPPPRELHSVCGQSTFSFRRGLFEGHSRVAWLQHIKLPADYRQRKWEIQGVRGPILCGGDMLTHKHHDTGVGLNAVSRRACSASMKWFLASAIVYMVYTFNTLHATRHLTRCARRADISAQPGGHTVKQR